MRWFVCLRFRNPSVVFLYFCFIKWSSREQCWSSVDNIQHISFALLEGFFLVKILNKIWSCECPHMCDVDGEKKKKNFRRHNELAVCVICCRLLRGWCACWCPGANQSLNLQTLRWRPLYLFIYFYFPVYAQERWGRKGGMFCSEVSGLSSQLEQVTRSERGRKKGGELKNGCWRGHGGKLRISVNQKVLVKTNPLWNTLTSHLSVSELRSRTYLSTLASLEVKSILTDTPLSMPAWLTSLL